MDAAALNAILSRHRNRPGALLPILHDIQESFGHVPDEVVAPIASELNLSRAEVHGVASFYHHFRRQPAGRHLLQVCRAEACQARGAERLLAHIQKVLGCGLHQTSADGAFTVEPAYCLGHCACGPALTADGRAHAQMSAERFDALTASLKDQA